MSDTIRRILLVVRRLDEETTLGGILDAVAEGVAAEGLRAAVLLIDRGQARAYRQQGFHAGDLPAEMSVAGSPVLAEAVLRCAVVAVSDFRGPHVARPLAFPRVDRGRAGLVLPLVVDQSVVALVYVDGAADTPEWSEAAEVLVRHASARLESVTSQRTVEALTASS